MFDKDTLIVSYDTVRGEPRGSRSRQADTANLGLGSCIDCSLCVQVCPTGIDIRKGLQYECIGCAACVDVCDTVMDKMHYPRGLIRYSTQNAIAQGWTPAQVWHRVRRPRVLVYAALLLLLCVALLGGLALRTPLKVDVVRDRASLARVVDGGRLENVYRLQVMNATESAQQVRISVRGLSGLSVASQDQFNIDAAQSRWVPIRLQLPYDAAPSGSHPIQFVIQTQDQQWRVTEKSVFLVPR